MNDLFNGARIRLTAPYPGDEDVVRGWYEDSEYTRFLDTDIAFPKTVEAARAETAPGDKQLMFHIRARGDNRLLGFVALHSIEWKNQTAQIAIGIGSREDRGKGYGGEALALILQYAFYELGFHRVGLEVISGNNAAYKVYERAGFSLEGRRREFVYRDGSRYDLIMMGILRREWEAAQRAKLEEPSREPAE